MYYSFLIAAILCPPAASSGDRRRPGYALPTSVGGRAVEQDGEIYTKRSEISLMSEDASLAFLKGKIDSFERRHGCNLRAFEDRLKQLPEDFELWDDFIEWMAYSNSLKDLESRISD